MTGKKQSRGTCSYCGAEIAVGGINKHLAGCRERLSVIEKAEQGPGTPDVLFHLHVKDAYRSEYWLDLEIAGTRTLNDIDKYLRAIWLECCGHLSQFTRGGWQGRQVAKARRVVEVFAPGIELTHIYDFGTSSITLVKCVEVRHGRPTTKRPIALMARNMMPVEPCVKCGEPATQLCMECVIEEDTWGTLCDEHARTHDHEDYGTLPLVNSPRVGMCGYAGPADPPY